MRLTQESAAARGEEKSSAESPRIRAISVALVLALTFLTYLQTLGFQFVEDDQFLILGNPFLRAWRYVPHYFSAGIWDFRHPDIPDSYYRPLYLLWFRLNYAIFGTHPWGWHLTTVLAHVGATYLVYRLARRLLGDWVAALFAALIFGLHPIHIEGAAWISGVSEPLLAVLLIPAYLCFLKAAGNTPRSLHWLAASLALFILALLVKETALVLPLLVFVTQLTRSGLWGSQPGEPWRRRLVASAKSCAPYLVLTAPYLVVRSLALKSFLPPADPISFFAVVSTWPSLLWLYLKHLLWPAGLSAFYDLNYVVHPNWRNAVLPALPVALAAIVLLWAARRSRNAFMASLWLVLPMLPVLNVRVFGNGNFAHDRYLYIPSVGFAMLAALALRHAQVGRERLLGVPAIQVALALLLACAMGLSTTSQSSPYANRVSFFTSAYAAAPDSDAAKWNRAGLLGEQGNYAEAETLLQQVLASNKDSGFINYDLGYTYYLMGRLEEAEYYLLRAVQLMPKFSDAYFFLGMTQLRMGHLQDAGTNIRHALALSPYSDNYHFGLGMVMRKQNDLSGALAEFRSELAFNPSHAEARRQAAEIEKTMPSGQAP